jgi:GTP-binding protein HflX
MQSRYFDSLNFLSLQNFSLEKVLKFQIGSDERGKGLAKAAEQALLIAVIQENQHMRQTEEQVTEYLDELEFLALTAGAETVRRFTQRLPHPNSLSYVGKGKIEEIQKYISWHEELTLVVVDDDLSPKQQSFLEEAFKLKVLDRSTLILDIFAQRAQTAQAKAQVELAQMQYLLPRLRGLWTHLERQRGGIGMRGPGEKEIETDRRIVRDKIAGLKRELEQIDRQAQTQRKQRGAMIRVAMVGYTNVGKSSLLNTLAKAEVFAENKLFATLDTTVRKVVFEAMPFLLSDTVGFIRKLPHHLVESFKSTLDETRESDILLHVVDLSHPQYEDHIATVQTTLKELGVADKPILTVFNKIDLYRDRYFDALVDEQTKNDIEAELLDNLTNKYGDALIISAATKEGIEVLKEKLGRLIKEQYVVRYPHQAKQW